MRIFFVSLLLFNLNPIFGQIITGSVVNVGPEENLSASILISDTTTPNEVKEFVISRNGTFSISLKNTYANILVEVTSNGYFPAYDTIKNPRVGKTYNLNFLLHRNNATALDEVVVTTKRNPFVIKKDTVAYRVSGYSDGTEKKVEDVIKKLPGVQVNETSGEIKYLGKSIETVLLEGDNLFGFNYSIGTKNINVDMVEQVEAIENYSENPLLKDVEQGDKVVLNLKLKKGKMDMSGSLDMESGLYEEKDEAFNFSSTLLGIAKKYKSFATLSYNNVGINRSPFNYFSFNLGVEQLKEKEYLAEKFIPESLFSTSIDDSRANINNQFFGNYNSIFKISKKLSVKTNLYYIKDKIEGSQLFNSQYKIDETQTFTTIDQTSYIKNPQQYRGDIKLTHNTSAKSLLEYDAKIRQENINTLTTITSNNTNKYTSLLRSEDFYLNQKLLFTQKLTENKVFQSIFLHTLNDIPQNLNIAPTANPVSDQFYGSQKSHHKKNFVGFENSLLGNDNGNKYSFSIGASMADNYYGSSFSPYGGMDSNTNDLKYSINRIYQLGGYDWTLKKWKISPSYSLSFLYQKLKDRTIKNNLEESGYIFEPSLNIKYIFNKNASLKAQFDYSQNAILQEHMFLNRIILNNRVTVSNIPSLKTQKLESVGVSYIQNNLKKQFQVISSLNYGKSKGNFFSNMNINETSTHIEYFFDLKKMETLYANILMSKYVPFIESTIRVTSNYSLYKYENIVNNSEWRKNVSYSFSNELFFKTAFDIPINFENIFTWSHNNAQSENRLNFSNNAIDNVFAIILKPLKNWMILLSSEYILPETENNKEDYLFLDTTVNYVPKNTSFKFGVSAKNLGKETNFEKITTTDVSTDVFRVNLLPRHILLNASFSF